MRTPSSRALPFVPEAVVPCHFMCTSHTPDDRFIPVAASRTFGRIVRILGLGSKRTLDIGCGYGEYLVHFGKESVGITTTKAEIAYGAQHSLQIHAGNAEIIDELKLPGTFDAIWANNLFEHLLAPHGFLIRLKMLAHTDTMLVLGVPVVPRVASLMRLTPFRGALAVAHVNFFTRETLRLTVERAGWHVQTARPFIFENSTLDWWASFVAPHLYVVALHDANFRYHPKKLKEWKDDAHYDRVLAITHSRTDMQV